MQYSIKSPNFDICFQPKVFEADIAYSSNTILSVFVRSGDFCGKTDMDIDIKAFAEFVDALSALYDTLNGTAIIREPYGYRQFIEFTADRSGHIGISGEICANSQGGFLQKLAFENTVDQTYFPDFIKNLSLFCDKYR